MWIWKSGPIMGKGVCSEVWSYGIYWVWSYSCGGVAVWSVKRCGLTVHIRSYLVPIQ